MAGPALLCKIHLNNQPAFLALGLLAGCGNTTPAEPGIAQETIDSSIRRTTYLEECGSA